MKQQVSRPTLIAVIVIAVLAIGFIGWKVLGSQSDVQDADSVKAHDALKRKKEDK